MRIAVAMSGGVDSSVAALLLKREGHDLLGLTMQVWVEEHTACSPSRDNTCCGESHVNDARRVAEGLGFPHYTLDFREAFQEHVVRNFKNEYAAGRTPIPCIHCNKSLKFDLLLRKVRQLGFEALATGHYVRREWDEAAGIWRVFKSSQAERDQSYFLYSLTQEQVAFLRFPLGTWSKQDARALAAAHHVPTHDKPDSQDICFVPNGDYRAVLESIPDFQARAGEIVDTGGQVLGRHDGLHRYTVGQRKGLGIAAEHPLYVVRLDPERGQVVVGGPDDLLAGGVRLRGVNWLAGGAPLTPFAVTIKLRSAHQGAPAKVTAIDGDVVTLCFDQPERAVTPGQAGVIYHGDELLGGGWITGASPTLTPKPTTAARA